MINLHSRAEPSSNPKSVVTHTHASGESLMIFYIVTIIILGILLTPKPVRATRKYFTEERLEIVQNNLKNYEWAHKQSAEILSKANHWAKYDDEKLRTLVIPPQVPRAYQVHNDGCPIHGVKVHEKGLYKWLIDFDKPFQITCPVGGETYPSNDFQAYLSSGMKDRSLLTGEYADDGWGWHQPGDTTTANHWFVAYYAHWSMMRFLFEAVENLSHATLLSTNETQATHYAHKTSLLLWQIAVHYPNYEYEKQSRESKEHNPEYTGKMFNMIWETWPPHKFALAYDAVKPFLKNDRDLQNIAKKNGGEIDQMIRERIFRESAIHITEGTGRIRGNYGMHQKTLLTLAQVLDETHQSPTSQDMIQYVLANTNLKRDTDMGLQDALENLVYRDGMPHESIGYNRMWIANLIDLADRLTGVGINLFTHPRIPNLLAWPFNVYIAGQFTPSTGDTGDMFATGGIWQAEVCQKALSYINDPRLAWVLQKQAPNTEEGLADTVLNEQNLFNTPAESILENAPPPENVEIGLRSFHFPAYGMANLQCGNKNNRTAVSFFYGDHKAHMHRDQLNILFFSHGNALLNDIGYPEQTDRFNHRLHGFFTNTIAHNTVVVDAQKQNRGPGKLHGLTTKGFAQIIDASCENAYPDQVTQYRRVNMLIQATPEQSYLFDTFYVSGGTQHDYALHGTQADFECQSLGPVRKKGTLAGEEVPYEQFYDDPELKDKKLSSVSYTEYKGSGFQFLYNVQEGKLDGATTATWHLTEPIEGQPQRPWEGVGLKAHCLGENETLFGCDGPVQKYQYLPKSIKFFVRRRTGENLKSRFTTIFEPYQNETWIAQVTQLSISPEDNNASAVRIDLKNGEQHYLFHSCSPDQHYTLDGTIQVSGQAACLVLNAQGQPSRATLFNGTQLKQNDLELKGQGLQKSHIVAIDYQTGIVEIADPVLDPNLPTEQVFLIKTETFTDSLTLHKIIDKNHFSIGHEDVMVAGGTVDDVQKNCLISRSSNPHAKLGMTLLNSSNEPQGKLIEKLESGWRIDRGDLGPMNLSHFPKNKDAKPRYKIVMAGPADSITIPSLIQYHS